MYDACSTYKVKQTTYAHIFYIYSTTASGVKCFCYSLSFGAILAIINELEMTHIHYFSTDNGAISSCRKILVGVMVSDYNKRRF